MGLPAGYVCYLSELIDVQLSFLQGQVPCHSLHPIGPTPAVAVYQGLSKTLEFFSCSHS
jgi:hypothetical protein